MNARPKALIENGQLNDRVMRRELMTREEVSPNFVCTASKTSGVCGGPAWNRTE